MQVPGSFLTIEPHSSTTVINKQMRSLASPQAEGNKLLEQDERGTERNLPRLPAHKENVQ
jgi:hypothetical protein